MPSNSAPGSGRGRTPVAITIDSAEIVSPPTWTLCGATTLATPNFELDLVLAEQPLDALVQLAGDAPAAADHLGEVPARLAAEAELRRRGS